MSNLRELLAQSNHLETLLTESDGIITPEIEVLLAVKELNLPAKVDAYGYFIDSLTAKAKFYKEQSEAWELMSKRIELAQERLKDNMRLAMLENGIEELVGLKERFKMMISSGSVKITNQSEIPQQYKSLVQTEIVDKKAIGEELKKNLPVPGTTLEINSYVRRFTAKVK